MNSNAKPKRKAPAFLLYVDDFLAGTMEMSQSEVGAYIRLLCHQWNRGSIPVEPEKQQRLAGGSVSVDVLAKFRSVENGQLKNDRLESVRADRKAFCELQAQKGRKSAEIRKMRQPEANRNSTAVEPDTQPNGQPDTQPDTQPEFNSPSPSPFPIKDVGASAKPAPTSDEDFIASLETNEAYAGIDIRREFARMTTWCEVNQKKPTQRRFVNWLNRADRPMFADTKAIGWNQSAAKPKPVFVQIKELESQIWDHPANPNALKSRIYDPTWTGDKKEADKADYKALKARLEALQQGQTE